MVEKVCEIEKLPYERLKMEAFNWIDDGKRDLSKITIQSSEDPDVKIEITQKKESGVMNTTIILQRQVRELKETLQDAVSLAAKYKGNMGIIDQEELARLSKQANGSAYIRKISIWLIGMGSSRST